MHCDIEGLTVFITGASRLRGIGRALIKEALKRGAKKVYATARDINQLNDLVAQDPKRIVALELDLTSLQSIRQAVEKAQDTQVLINNAGFAGFSGCVHHYSETVAREEFEVNFFAPLHLMNAFSKYLIANGKGAIVNIISIGGFMPFPRAATYSASKSALHSITQAARMEMNQYGLPVFGVYPGPIDTDMSDQLNVNKESPDNVARRIFHSMERGIENITTDQLADAFVGYLKVDPVAYRAVCSVFKSGHVPTSM